jgi:riboflavin kinase/FMN adenylyltransferase
VDSPSQHAASARAPRRVVAIGNFDGVHLGHQALLADVAKDAAARDRQPAVLTFAPHPLAVLGRPVDDGGSAGKPAYAPMPPPPALTSLDRKLGLVRRVAKEIVPFVRRFDRAFASLSPEAFVLETLVDALAAEVVVVGQNFRFGKDRKGDFAELARLGERHGFETRSHDLYGDAEGAWSSSRVRECIGRGALDEAARILGRPHLISGVVVEGDRRGRTIGFPTANLAEVEEALPPFGVYAVLVDREPAPDPALATLPDLAAAPPRAPGVALAKGVANIGVRPTVKAGETRPSVEVHLFDTNLDLYGARLGVHLVARLRPEQRFSGLDALKAQIARDAEAARTLLAPMDPDPAAGGAWR